MFRDDSNIGIDFSGAEIARIAQNGASLSLDTYCTVGETVSGQASRKAPRNRRRVR